MFYTIKTRDTEDYAIVLYKTHYKRRRWWFDKVVYQSFPWGL